MKCEKCGLRYGDDAGKQPCWRCRPLSETTGPSWLPEDYSLKLSAFEVGFLFGIVSKSAHESEHAVPAGILRLLKKIEEQWDRGYHDESAGLSWKG